MFPYLNSKVFDVGVTIFTLYCTADDAVDDAVNDVSNDVKDDVNVFYNDNVNVFYNDDIYNRENNNRTSK